MNILEILKENVSWAKYNGGWSHYQLEIGRMMFNYPSGFPTRKSVVEVLTEIEKIVDDKKNEKYWDFFCAVMIWGGIEEKNAKKVFGEEQKNKIIEKIKEIDILFQKKDDDCKNLKAAYNLFNNEINGLGVSFFTKVLYFLGLIHKENLSCRPFIYDSVMAKNLCYIYLKLENDIPIGDYSDVFEFKNFKFNIKNNIKRFNPSSEVEAYVKFCKFLHFLSEKTGEDVDNLDEKIFGVANAPQDKVNFRNLLLNDTELNSLIDRATEFIPEQKRQKKNNLKNNGN